MKRFIARHAMPVDLGFSPALTAVVIGGGLALVFTLGHIGILGNAGNDEAVRTNMHLLGGLAAAYTVWSLAVSRLAITAATGAGFVLAGYALAARSATEFLRAMLGPYWERLQPETGVVDAVEATRTAGFIAYVAGLAFVASACLAERRFDRRAPAARGLGHGRLRGRPRRAPDVFR